MQSDGRATAAQLHHLHLAPRHTTYTSTKGLADGFFGGETPGQPRGLAPALAQLHLSKYALEETFPVRLINLAHTLDLDDINANRHINALRHMQRRAQPR